jgi:hypothetical protein
MLVCFTVYQFKQHFKADLIEPLMSELNGFTSANSHWNDMKKNGD